MTYGYGMRSGTMHQGLDLTPGEGAQIQSIADGTVRIATEAGGGYGVMVIIDHVIDGRKVASRYAHMQSGSLRVQSGQTIAAGETVGAVGNTGRSFGAHLHLEIMDARDQPFDPLPFLRSGGM